MQYRYLSKSGSGETIYSIGRDPNDYSTAWHTGALLTDPTGAVKQWGFFFTNAFWNGLTAWFYQAAGAGQSPLRRLDFGWSQDSTGNPYVASSVTTLDVGSPNQQVSTTNQTLDTHGNLLQSQIYDFGNSSTPARTYTNTYLTDTNYTSRGIWNRLLTSQVSNGGQAVTLVTNQYDTSNPPCGQGGFFAFQPVTSARQHDDANYGTNFPYRGNPTYHADLSASSCNTYYVTGAVYTSNGTHGSFTASTTSTTNYAAPSAITANNVTTTLAYTGFLGMASATGQNSDTMSIGYDAAARPSTVTSPTGATTSYSYSVSPPMTTASTGGHYVESDLDGLGRPIRVKTGDSTGVKSWADTEYDSCACSPLGKMKRTSQPYPPNGSPAAWTTYTYDALGRTVSVVSPDGASATTYLYQGNTTTITDPAGKWKKYVTDAMGHLIQVIEPNPGNN